MEPQNEELGKVDPSDFSAPVGQFYRGFPKLIHFLW